MILTWNSSNHCSDIVILSPFWIYDFLKPDLALDVQCTLALGDLVTSKELGWTNPSFHRLPQESRMLFFIASEVTARKANFFLQLTEIFPEIPSFIWLLTWNGFPQFNLFLNRKERVLFFIDTGGETKGQRAGVVDSKWKSVQIDGMIQACVKALKSLVSFMCPNHCLIKQLPINVRFTIKPENWLTYIYFHPYPVILNALT